MPEERVARLVSSVGRTRTLELEDGSIVERSGGSVSWRNNNPGNLKFEFADSADTTVTTQRTREQALRAAQDRYQGVVGLDQWGNAVFESYEAGRAAKIQLLERKHSGRSVEEMLRSYSTADYSGNTNHRAQADFIYGEGHRQGVDLRGKTIGQMTEREKAALADGIRGFEGFKAGETRVIKGPTRAGSESVAQALPPLDPQRDGRQATLPNAAIYSEARRHFFDSGNRYEYGRSDLPKPGRDPSRIERDADGDGRRGVDCSAFVWRGLKNAGYNVHGQTAAAFTTHSLFNGRNVTPYARQNFDVIPAADARKPGGALQPGDLLMFSSKGGQHIGIFKGYDQDGRIQYIGSQGSTGPAEVTIAPNGYWDGKNTTIVGALRAKPEFQMRPPLNGNADQVVVTRELNTPSPVQSPTRSNAVVSSSADGMLEMGEKGEDIREAQQTLNRLGYQDAQGRPLQEDGDFGPNSRAAVGSFQKEHGLKGLDIIGPRTSELLSREDAKLVTHASHSDHVLYKHVLERVYEAEKTRGIPPGDHSLRLAATLTVEARREQLERIDRVELNADGSLARAVQVNTVRDEAGLNQRTDAISTQQAVQQSLRESSEQLAQVNANVEARQRDETSRPQLAPQAVSPSM